MLPSLVKIIGAKYSLCSASMPIWRGLCCFFIGVAVTCGADPSATDNRRFRISEEAREEMSDASVADLESLQGSWKIVSFTIDGKKVEAPWSTFIIKNDDWIIPEARRQPDEIKMKFHVNADVNPKQIEFVETDLMGKAIYRFTEGGLQIVFGKAHPKSFEMISQGEAVVRLERKKNSE